MGKVEIRGRNFLGFEIEIKSSSLSEIQSEIKNLKNLHFLKNAIVTLLLNDRNQLLAKSVVEILKDNGIAVSAIELNDASGCEFFGIPIIELKNVTMLSKTDEKKTSVFRGSLRSGQTISTNGTLVITGNVNDNSYIYATEDIYVLGILNGIPHAGYGVNHADSIIFAFEINSPQLRIENLISRSPEHNIKHKYKNNISTNSFEIAYIENGNIVISRYTDWIESK